MIPACLRKAAFTHDAGSLRSKLRRHLEPCDRSSDCGLIGIGQWLWAVSGMRVGVVPKSLGRAVRSDPLLMGCRAQCARADRASRVTKPLQSSMKKMRGCRGEAATALGRVSLRSSMRAVDSYSENRFGPERLSLIPRKIHALLPGLARTLPILQAWAERRVSTADWRRRLPRTPTTEQSVVGVSWPSGRIHRRGPRSIRFAALRPQRRLAPLARPKLASSCLVPADAEWARAR